MGCGFVVGMLCFFVIGLFGMGVMSNLGLFFIAAFGLKDGILGMLLNLKIQT